ncbi:hypothetical protein DFJ63DRAFT_98981 [Scheffersomyces coipomensis]|uniref:uncharacterized protein n=1 Tax=Scheffersomyces coipomensis TaxID=1788519 RepID=UPI00315D052A
MAFQSQFISVVSTSLVNNSSWIYLVDWILALILGLAFVFYFNRLVGYIISLILKIFLWKKYKILLNVESLKIAPLGGRVFAKNVTLTSSTQTISILHMNLTWRYWIFRVTRLSDFHFINQSSPGKKISRSQNEKLPCRFLLIIDGMEVFMYNRTVAYENILKSLDEEINLPSNGSESSSGKDSSFTSKEATKEGTSNIRQRGSSSSTDYDISSTSSTQKEALSPVVTSEGVLAYLLRIFPIKVRIKKGAFVLGNSSTPSLLLASFDAASGIFDVSQPTDILDCFKSVWDFNFDKFQLWLKSNINHDKYRYSEEKNPEYRTDLSHYKKYKHWYKFQIALKSLDKLLKKFRKPKPVNDVEADFLREQWRGLKRYVGDQIDPKSIIQTEEEYAKYSLILDSVSTRIIYYYDLPGIVPFESTSETLPEFGVEVELSLTTIHYGPWADRQRVPIQNMFFPSAARDSEPSPKPLPGSLRQYGGFQATVIVKDEVIVRVPTREPSKLKEIYRSSTVNRKRATPPFGWLEFKLGVGSNVSSFTTYFANEKGWPNKLRVMFNAPEIRTSVNHDVLFIADTHEINADVGFPLEWNGKCDWVFNQVSHNARIFFLREHTMLFSDLFEDFASGEPVQYEYFRQFLYTIDWKINDYKIYLNVNDANIINNPLDFNNNKYLSFQGDSFDLKVDIPLNGTFSKSTTVSFNFCTSAFDLILDTPAWHTTSAFMKESKIMGSSKDFSVTGSYTFFSMVEINTSDVIDIRCLGDYVSLKFYGFLIRYLFSIRENYFGDFIHFRTFEEYTDTLDDDGESKVENIRDFEDIDYWNIVKTDNDVDVFFFFQVRHGLIILPHNIYSCDNHVGLAFDSLDIDIRFCNYYMDLQADFSPVRGVFVHEGNSQTLHNMCNVVDYRDAYLTEGKEDIKIDGLSIHAHRMFGLPPEEITYLCVWEFAADSLEIEGFPILDALSTAIPGIAFGFKDVENALHSELPVTYDGMTVSFCCPKTSIKIVPDVAVPSRYIIANLDSLRFNLCDIFNNRYSNKLTSLIPCIEVQIIEEFPEKKILGYFKTSLVFDNIDQKAGMLHRREQLINHMKMNDAPFHRCPFILYPEDRSEKFNDAYGCFMTSLSLPSAPAPVTAETYESDSDEGSYTDLNSSVSSESDYSYRTKFLPTLSYNEADFIPSTKIEPDCGYDSFILELQEVNMFLTPDGLLSLAKLASLKQLCADALIDIFQMEMVGSLKMYLTTINKITNLRVVCPDISLHFGNFDVSEPREVFAKSHLVPTINIQLVEPSLALSTSLSKKSGEIASDDNGKTVAAFHLKELLCNISNPVDFQAPLFFSIKDIEFWFQEDNEIVNSINIESITAEVQSEQIEWLLQFFLDIKTNISPVIAALQEKPKGEKDAIAEMIYKLSMAAIDYHIDHDPGVLTKPAYILRAKKDHVRFFDIWKVITRIRHIKDNLPKEWYDEMNIGLGDWKLPPTAYDDVKDVFARWRSWEANQDQRNYMFRKIFKDESKLKDIIQTHLEIANLSIIIGDNSNQNDDLTLLSLSGNIKKSASDDLIEKVDVIINAHSYKSKLTTVTLNSIKKCLTFFSNLENKSSTRSKAEETNTVPAPSVFTVVNLRSFQQHILLPVSSYEIIVKDVCASANILNSCLLTASVDMGSFDVNIWGLEHRIISAKLAAVGLLVASTDEKAKKVDLSIGAITLKTHDQQGFLPVSIQKIISEDVTYLKSFDSQKDSKNVDERPFSLEDLNSVSFSAELGEVNIVIEAIPRLVIRSITKDTRVMLSASQGNLNLNWSASKLDFLVFLDKSQIFELQNSQMWLNSDISSHGELILVKLDSGLGHTKIFIPDLNRTSEKILGRKQHIMNSISKFEDIFKSVSSNKKPTKVVKTTKDKDIFENVVYKINFANDYVGIVTMVEEARYSYEMESTSLGIYNVANIVKENNSKSFTIVPVYGELVVPATRLYVIHKSVPARLSNVLDVNFSIRLFNDVDKGCGSQSLQVESQYCRICLNSSSLIKLVSFADNVGAILHRFESAAPKTASSKSKSSSKSSSEPIKLPTSVQFLSYNFCAGWLCTTAVKEYPGVIFGAERFFVVAEDKLGKFTLMDAYLSVANGSSSSNFYSLSSEKNNLNRAFLPNMQLIYSVEEANEKKNMRIIITGDELDVKFLSTSMIIVENLGNSVNDVQDFFKKRSARMAHIPVKKYDDQPSNEYISNIQSAFDSIEFVATFAGSNVLFYRLDADETGETPSLYLHSPAVRIAFMYKHRKFEKVKHIIKGEVLTSPSDNTLYASCVPVIVDIVEGVKRMMQNSNSADSNLKKLASESMVTPTNQGDSVDFNSIFGDMDIHFGLKIEKQQLSLSCEPTAKVAMIVGLDSIYIQLNSSEPGLDLTILFDSMSGSLQHIYSREISASISIQRVLLSSSLDIHDGLKFRSSGCLIDVDGYVNVKQYQDVELFTDIWFPKQQSEVYSKSSDSFVNKLDSVHNRNLTSRFKEVSTTYAIPWVVTFFVSTISLRVDFGPSLCDTKLNIDTIWAISKKSTDWSQDLKLGVNAISLNCEGRLGGNLMIKEFNIHTAISWMSDKAILDIPLILVSAGFEKFHLKLSFDYHVFSIANIEGFSMNVFNQHSDLSDSKDRLFIRFRLDAAEIYITSLTASNCLDIYNTISRMLMDNKKSYKETLRDGKGMKEKTESAYEKLILETVKRLETKIEVSSGRFLIHVYPTSFNDSKVLVVRLDESKVNFQQNEYSSGISNELDIQFNDLTVSLSMTQAVPDEFIASCTVEQFVEYASKAKGGTIFVFPSFKIAMRTFQKDNENVIEFLYQSTFDGVVDIRWNLGSVNFIREMFSIHRAAVASRTVFRRAGDSIDFKEQIFESQGRRSSNIMRQQLNEEDPTDEIDQAITETMSKVSDESRFRYVPLAPPIIEAPQLRELGNATPPLEWFGLHRNKFPNVTHEFGIVSLQKVIREVEIRYSKILGKA